MRLMMKRILSACMILVIILQCDMFAAIVSDNDGSAFVTKAEFDALKNNFNKQIDDYNDSIDGKIDGAVASYLSGIKISQAPTDEWERIKNVLGGNNLRFKNKFKSVSSLNIKPEVNVSTTRDLCAKGEWGIYLDGKLYWQVTNGTTYDGDGGVIYAIFGTKVTDPIAASAWEYRLARWDKQVDPLTNGAGVRIIYTDISRNTYINWTKAVAQCTFTKKKDIQANQTDIVAGEGQSWIYHKTPAGVYYLRQYAESIWPVMNISVWRHDYKDFSFTTTSASQTNFNTWYLSDNGKNLGTTATTLNVPSKSDYGSWSGGTKYTGDSETSGTYYEENIAQLKVNDGIDYSIYQYGTDFTNKLGCISDISKPTAKASAETINVQNMTWTSVYFNQGGENKQINKFNDMKVNYYPLTQTLEEIEPNKFANEYVSGVAGETVYLGGGAPIATTFEEGNIKLQLKFLSYKPDGSFATTDTVKYSISDKQFVKGDFATGASKIVDNKSITVGATDTVDYYMDKKGTLWINMYSTTAGNDVTLDSFIIG